MNTLQRGVVIYLEKNGSVNLLALEKLHELRSKGLAIYIYMHY